MEKAAASIVSILIGAPLYLPWIFARLGKYKRWYLAYFAPPFMWGKAIYAWPMSAFFISTPIIGLLPITPESRTLVWGIIGIIGVILGFLMILWQPKWAKPDWQRYLEDKYAWREIRGVFIPHWRQMDRQTWNRLMDSEEGIDELVRMAREKTYGYP
ncbi:MAG: hypothetical protein WAS33_07725 [Candidatus Promineifilaceae bacterium]